MPPFQNFGTGGFHQASVIVCPMDNGILSYDLRDPIFYRKRTVSQRKRDGAGFVGRRALVEENR